MGDSLKQEEIPRERVKETEKNTRKKIEDLYTKKIAPSAMTVPTDCVLADRINELIPIEPAKPYGF